MNRTMSKKYRKKADIVDHFKEMVFFTTLNLLPYLLCFCRNEFIRKYQAYRV
jgi:hypothetical protein